jgi:hypothetical protein
MISVPDISVPFIMSGHSARRELNGFKKFIKSTAIRLSNPDINMENLLHTEDQWIAMHPIIDDNGNAIPPTPRLPQRPAELAANASNTQVTIHGSKTRIADTALLYSNAFKTAILQILGPDIASETEHFDTGHEMVPIWTLYHHVLTHYGTKSPEDIAFFRQELRHYDMDKPFSTNAARYRRIFTELADLHMYTSEVDRVAALIEATQHVPSIGNIVLSYLSLHPTIASQSFSSLSTYIVEQLPVATAQIRAHNINLTNQNDNSDIAALRAELASVHATIAALSISSQKKLTTTIKKSKVPNPTAQDTSKWTPGRLYCWKHGFVKHNGSDCTILEHEAQWKRDAKNPGPIHGQYGSRNLE